MRNDRRSEPKSKTRDVGSRHQGDPENYDDHLNGAPVDYGERQPPQNEPAAPRMPFHPAAEKFPLMNDAELQALAKDIKDHGLNEDIETLDGMVLDGRNRYNACLMIGSDIRPHIRALSDNTDPRDHLVSKNLMRRHSTELQRAMFAARLVTATRGGDKKSEQYQDEKSNHQNDGLIYAADAARRIGVSQIAVERARYILANAADEFVAAIDKGIPWLKLGYAHNIAHAEKEDQRLWLDNHKHAIKPVKRARKAPRTPLPITANVLNALKGFEALVVIEKLMLPAPGASP
jgi:hypothetical protein